MESSFIKLHNKPGYIFIENNSKLFAYLKLLDTRNIFTISLDIEAESNLHAYGQKLCLVQIFDGANAVLIDPFKVDRDPLKYLFENRDILKVMYGAASDIALLKNTLDIQLKSILDLSPAAALLHFEKQDLYSVISSELGIVLKNKAKFQTYNWMLRPIGEAATEYAVNDVIHLLKLKDSLTAKLYEKRLLESFLLRNLKIQNKDYTRKRGIKYARFRGYELLEADEKAVAQKVIDTIDKYAATCDMPFDSIVPKSEVIEVVKDPSQLVKIKFPKKLSDRHIEGITRELQSILQG